MLKMQERGIEVLDLHDLLAETLRRHGGARLGARPPHHRQRRRPGRCAARSAPWLDEMPATKLAEHLIGGIAVVDLPKSEMVDAADARRFGGTDFIAAAGAEHAVPARPVLLDLQRRHLQPDVLAGAQARDAAAARGLQVPPARSRATTSRSGGATPTRTSARHRSRAAT